MRSGELNRSVLIQSPTKSKDSEDSPVVTWSNLATVNAMVTMAGSSERYRDQQNVLTDDRLFKIWYRDDITSEMQIIYDGLAYEIIAEPKELGLHEGLEILGRNVDSSV